MAEPWRRGWVGVSPVPGRITDSPVVSADHYLRRELALAPVSITLKPVAIAMRLEETALHKGALQWVRGRRVEIGVSRFVAGSRMGGVSLRAVGAGGIASRI